MSELKDGNLTIDGPDGDNEVEIEIDNGDRYLNHYICIFKLKKWVDFHVDKALSKMTPDERSKIDFE